MNEFILNERVIRTDRPASITLLDFVRYENHLKGTKIGCREGDCGACTVLIGSLEGSGKVKYQSVTSCISPLGNAFGKHVVTIEGLKIAGLTQVQQALVDEGGTQCGFCTPGFVVSLTGYCLSCRGNPNQDDAISAIDGNICRCTGYKSIERSAATIASSLANSTNIEKLIENKFIPPYFRDIPKKLENLVTKKVRAEGVVVGGGTDLYVQRPEELARESIKLFAEKRGLSGIQVKGGICHLGAATTVTHLLESEEMNQIFPNLRKHLKLVSSTQIRNMGTIAGNFVNASPIGDLTIFFLALNATIHLRSAEGKRSLPLRKFYLGYKQLDKEKDEFIESLEFRIPDSAARFNFEKVSKRTHLDIASVNTALQISVSENRIESLHLSAGGIGPIPTYLEKTCESLVGETLTAKTIKSAARVMAKEISPISDVRGSAKYKSLLLRQLFFAHFLEIFPNQFSLSELI